MAVRILKRPGLALAIATAAGLFVLPALAGPDASPLVSPEWVIGHLGDPDLRIVDLRSGAEGEADYSAAHIPGSIRSDYPGNWRNPDWSLPESAAIAGHLSGLGIGPETTVVVVPAGTGSSELGGATWAYWVLRYLGHEEVAILDGGWTGWEADASHPVEAGPSPVVTPAEFVPDIQPDLLIDTDAVAARLGTTAVVDARPPDQFRAGHIPGALSLDNARLYDAAANRLKRQAGLEAELPPELADRSEPVIVYCNTGHWSSIVWFTLHELLGFDNAVLYAGSMAAWKARAELPIALGP
jgi:thiosulfate/3-mercaptopyruvate sulfurtransferase